MCAGHRCTMSKQPGNEWPGQGGGGGRCGTSVARQWAAREDDVASEYGYTGTPVHYEQTVREHVARPGKHAASGYGYTGTVRPPRD